MSDFRNTNYARGIRNNNPGNIIKSNTSWKGKVPIAQNTDSRFEQFTSMEYGIRALMKNIITWFKRGHNTLELLIHKWAPTFENNTNNYINIVSNRVGIPKNQSITSLDANTLIRLAKAIAYVENAPHHKYIPEADYQKAISILGEDLNNLRFDSKKKVVS